MSIHIWIILDECQHSLHLLVDGLSIDTGYHKVLVFAGPGSNSVHGMSGLTGTKAYICMYQIPLYVIKSAIVLEEDHD